VTRGLRETPPTVCLVTSGNLASNPRLVKEATALLGAGYRVSVVAADIIRSLSDFDAAIIGDLGCDVARVKWKHFMVVRVSRAVKQRVARLIARCFSHIPLNVALRAHHVLTPALGSTACISRADLYIAHNLAALPAAAAAARKYGAKLGFDAEDYHCGELKKTTANALELRVRRGIEAKLLPKCQHLTSASPQISAAYRRDYGVEMTPILNVFPLADAPDQPATPQSSSGELPSLYWFSQTVGRDRGLEQIVDAMGFMSTKLRLILRGNAQDEYIHQLRERAQRAGGQDLVARISLVLVSAPDSMIRLCAPHDLGLALELSDTTNRDICLTNKAFTYLLAGVPVLLSKTTAQMQLADELGEAALLVDIFDAQQIARALDDYFADPERQRAARAEAWRLGRCPFNWEAEQVKFLEQVSRALGSELCVS